MILEIEWIFIKVFHFLAPPLIIKELRLKVNVKAIQIVCVGSQPETSVKIASRREGLRYIVSLHFLLYLDQGG